MSTIESIPFNESKFRELLLYVASRCEDDPHFGAIKLNKILFLAEFIAYAETGKPISGAEYEALEFGPAPRLLRPIRDDMEKEREIVVKKRPRHAYTQHRVIPLRKPDLTLFTAEEIAFVETIIGACQGGTGKDLSDFTHSWRGWQIASYKETIPYPTIFLSEEPATKADFERARDLAAQHEWA